VAWAPDDRLRLFQREAGQQARFALIAARHVLDAAAHLDRPSPRPDAVETRDTMDRLWYAAQAFLVSTGNISKLLWGTDAETSPAGRPCAPASISPTTHHSARARFATTSSTSMRSSSRGWTRDTQSTLIGTWGRPSASWGAPTTPAGSYGITTRTAARSHSAARPYYSYAPLADKSLTNGALSRIPERETATRRSTARTLAHVMARGALYREVRD
jgi:hypothetical protein